MKSAYYTSTLLFFALIANVALGQEYGNSEGNIQTGTNPALQMVEESKAPAARFVVKPLPTPTIFQSAALNDVSAIHAYILEGGDLNAREGGTGATILMKAVASKSVAVIETLMNYTSSKFPNYPQAVQIDVTDALKQTALHYASKVNEATGEGQYILHLLLDAGANPNAVDSNGKTPLWNAIEKNQSYSMFVLLQEGADPATPYIRLADMQVISAYEYAQRKKNFASRELLAWRDRGILKRVTDAVAHYSYEVFESIPVLEKYAHGIYKSGSKTFYDDWVSGITYYTTYGVAVGSYAAVKIIEYVNPLQAKKLPMPPNLDV